MTSLPPHDLIAYHQHQPMLSPYHYHMFHHLTIHTHAAPHASPPLHCFRTDMLCTQPWISRTSKYINFCLPTLVLPYVSTKDLPAQLLSDQLTRFLTPLKFAQPLAYTLDLRHRDYADL